MTNFFGAKTDGVLLKKLENAAQHRQSSDEILEQSVSFVYGSIDKKSGVTRDQVRKLILEQDGLTQEPR